MSRGRHRGAAWMAVLTCALTAFCCLLLYTADNKYTAKGPQPAEGLFVLEESTLEQYPVLFLTQGWEYYSGRLLTPAELEQGGLVPQAYIYIGQFGGFEAGGLSDSPHGSASYRLRIRLPDAVRTYTLELPEIFSAYRLYINGREAAVMGDPSPQSYRAETGNRTVSIETGGEVELLFAVSDFSHLYSGMVYPPAFGEPAAVSRLLSTRLTLRGLIAAFALAVGLLAVLTGILSGRRSLAALYGLLCLCFVGFTSYPLLRTLGAGHPALYAVELISFCAMLVVVMLLQRRLSGQEERWSRYLIAFGGVMCLFSALLPRLLPGGSLRIMVVYSVAVSAYELLTAGFITITAILALRRGLPHSAVLLCGFLILDTALVMDRVLPLFEPIVGGWFYELSCFALILCVGGAVGQELAAKYREGAVLAERQSGMERLAQMQTAGYQLLMEKVEEAKTARHDLRHHFMMIDGFLKSREYEQLSAYVSSFRAAVSQDDPISYTPNIVADVLLRHYGRTARQEGIEFFARAELEREAGLSDADLCAVLSNLLENAMEACRRVKDGRRFISVTLVQRGSALTLQVDNSAVAATIRRRASDFLSSKADGRTGYGLSSVAAIAARYGGAAEFQFDDERGVFISTVLLSGA